MTKKLYINLSSLLSFQYIPNFTNYVPEDHWCWRAFASEAIIYLPPPPVQQCWLPKRQMPQRQSLIPQDQQCWSPKRWSPQRQLPQRQSLIPRIKCWSLRGNHLRGNHQCPLGSTALIPKRRSPQRQLSIDPPTDFDFLIFNIRIIHFCIF